jgi:hypothetical protein
VVASKCNFYENGQDEKDTGGVLVFAS